MGKGKKAPGDKIARPGALTDELTAPLKTSERNKRQKIEKEDEDFIDNQLSAKILRQARQQHAELQAEDAEMETPSSGSKKVDLSESPRLTKKLDSDLSDDEDDDEKRDQEEFHDFPDVEVDPNDEAAFETFMPKHNSGLLSDTLVNRTQVEMKREEFEKQLAAELGVGNREVHIEDNIDPRIVSMYRGVRKVLKSYRSGKLPKAFKIIPKLRNWEQIVFITEPGDWTAASMYQAVKIFCSNFSDKQCQKFYNLILLPRIRDDIAEFKKLNYHLYEALAKALFKPAAFFKGILLPLCESGTCTLLEATIIGSVVRKLSIPSLHSAAAMLKISEMDYGGANSLFLRVLIDKKYTLPYRVIDALVAHFVRFSIDNRELPILWHQALLAFVQRYKSDMSSEQREALMDLMRKHGHYQITPEIRRELLHTVPRDVEME